MVIILTLLSGVIPMISIEVTNSIIQNEGNVISKVICLIVVEVCGQILTEFNQFFILKIGREIEFSIKQKYFNFHFDVELDNFLRADFDIRCFQIEESISMISNGIIPISISLFSAIVSYISVTYLIALESKALSAYIVLVSLLQFIVFKKFERTSPDDSGRKRLKDLERLFTDSGSYSLLRVNGYYTILSSVTRKLTKSLNKKEQKAFYRDTIIHVIIMCLYAFFALIGIYLYYSYLVINSKDAIFRINGYKIVSSALFIGGITHTFKDYRGIWKNIRITGDFMDLIKDTSNRVRENVALKPFRNIKFVDVSYGYEAGNMMLRNLNFEIKKGDKVAITGCNGSGKSTLLNLLLGNLKGYKGDIYVNSKSLKEIKSVDYWSLFSVCEQKPSLVPLSIQENIGLVTPFSSLQSNFSIEDLLKLEEQLALNICRDYRDATKYGLSLGQQQRLMLVRTLLSSKEIKVFDEPTNFLDVENKDKLIESIKASHHTNIIATHDTDIIAICNVVFRIQDENVITERV